MVTELDPDAPTRQRKQLQADDAKDEERLMARVFRLLRAGEWQHIVCAGAEGHVKQLQLEAGWSLRDVCCALVSREWALVCVAAVPGQLREPTAPPIRSAAGKCCPRTSATLFPAQECTIPSCLTYPELLALCPNPAGRMREARELCELVGQPWRAASLGGGGGAGPLPLGAAADEADAMDPAGEQAQDLATEVRVTGSIACAAHCKF